MTEPAPSGVAAAERPALPGDGLTICKVWDSEYPWDVRVEKVASALTADGNRVHLLARNRDSRPLEEALPEATVHRLAPIPALGRGLNSAAMFPAFFNPRWLRLIDRIVRLTHADVILCRDLPLAPAAIRVGRRAGIPVVLDMAENYPAMIRAIWESKRHRPLDWFVRNPRVVDLTERWVIRRVDHILVVVEESGERVQALGVPGDRITVVSNTPPRSRLQDYQRESAPRPDAPLRLYYVGLLELPRGLGTLLEAVARCRQTGSAVELAIYGDGRDRELLEQQARRLGLSDGIVRFHGFVAHDAALAAMQDADVGVVPHFADDSWNSTIPNKLFDYMAAGMPVLSSDAKPAARVVRETGCGLVFRDRDPADLAGCIEHLTAREARRACSEAGRAAIADRYNWERDSARLRDAVRAVVTSRSTG